MTLPRRGKGCRRGPAALALALLLAACAERGSTSDGASPPTAIRDCDAWFARLDDAIDTAGVRDGEARAIPGFPYLRVNRFLASFRGQATEDPAAFAAWEDQMRELDRGVSSYELQNLPPASLLALGVSGAAQAAARSDGCAALLSERDRAEAARRDRVIRLAEVPDGYSDWKRAVGFYPLMRIPFFQMAKSWERETSQAFDAARAGEEESPDIVRYRPPAGASAAAVAAVFAKVTRDELGIPRLGARDAEILFAAFAPIFEVQATGDYDHIGALRWGKREAPEVDAARPTVYRRLAFTRYREQTLVQVVYLVWFSERPDSGWFDPVSGALDGLYFRVTLDPNGRPLVYDSVHPCGCYHMFFPTARVETLPPPDPDIEWAFTPRRLPAVEPAQRIVLRVTSGSHALTDIRTASDDAGAGITYTLADEGELRVLPTPTGTRNAFGPDGVVAGTKRGERFLVWPLGLEDPGSMHEWGGQTTATVGRRHFDDADLIERRFALLPSAEPSMQTGRSGP